MSDGALTVLVAGGERSPGREVISALVGAGHRVVALTGDARDLGEARSEAAAVRQVDLENDPAPEGLFEGVDVFYSSLTLAEKPRWPTPWEIDGEANLALVRRAAAEGVRQVIFVSATAGEELRFQADIAAAREQVVDAIKPLGMTWTVLRPAGTFSGLRRPFEICRERGAWFVVGGGRTRFNPIHPADLAALVVRALTDASLQNVALRVGGPEVFSLKEMGELACQALGRKPRVISVPTGAFTLAATGVRLYNANLAREMDVVGFLTGYDEVIGDRVGQRDLRSWFQELALQA
jgi:uncharacterized protein YbjT (DUF2867 family)